MKLKNIIVLGLTVFTLSSCSLLDSLLNKEPEEVTYDVSFYNDDKTTLLYSTSVVEGKDAVYSGSTPSKTNPDPSKTYTFNGWDKPLTNILADTNFYAKYNETINEYRCSFYNDDDSLLYEAIVHYNEDVTYSGPEPTKTTTDPSKYYVFKGWNKQLTIIKENTKFKAIYDEFTYEYKCTFYNYDDKLLYETKVAYGKDVTYNGIEPTKVSDDPSYYYYFRGWDNALTSITKDTTFHALYDKKVYEYKCTFNNYDNTLLYESIVTYGGNATYKGETPTKATEDGEIYTFSGWDKSLLNIKEDTVFTAVFSKKKAEYTITFVNYDDTVLFTTSVKHGSDAVYLGETPTKPKTIEFTYTFKGWDKPLEAIVSDTKFVAQYTETISTYNCVFYNGDNSILKSYVVEYNQDVTYDGVTPTKTLEGHTYTFKGWDKALTAIKENTNFYPVFDDVLKTYTVNFYTDDTKTTLLYTALDVPYGTSATYASDTPTKASTEYFSYTFSGWSASITSITKNTDVYAKFTSTRIKESRTVKSETSSTMGYTLVEPVTGDPYKTDYTYTPLTDSSTYAFDYLGTLTDKDAYQYYYCQIWESVVSVDDSNQNITTTKQAGGKTYYVFDTVSYKAYSNFSYDLSFLMGVLEMFRSDNPRSFFIMGRILYSPSTVSFVISDEYLSATTRSNAYSTIDSYVSNVQSLYSSFNEENKARSIYDKIILDTTYVNSEEESEHNVLGVADGSGAVCEGYSLMYTLCSYRVNLNTIWYVGTATVSGVSGGHAWNATKIGSTWYWLDPTRGDTTNRPNDYFKVKDSTFSVEHEIENTTNGNFDYLPAPSPLY